MPDQNHDLTHIIDSVRHNVDGFLTQQLSLLTDQPSDLRAAMEYALLGGGKRMRPLLCFLVADAVGADQQQTMVIASAIECIHSYSLIHDDLPAMDDDDTRRGRPTCHIVYGDATAILAGDALQSLAFELISSDESLAASPTTALALVKALANASGYQGMCGGQAIDLAATGETSAVPRDLATLTQLHRLKTGALLKACVTMPLLIAKDVAPAHQQAFSDFAEAIGLAFQVQDDILDEIGSEAQIGKPQGSDAQQHKLTYPALLGLDGARAELEKLYQQALQALAALPYNVQSLVAFCDLMIHRDH